MKSEASEACTKAHKTAKIVASKANACKESKKVAKEEKAQACDEVSVAQDAKVEAPKEETAKAVAPKTTEV